MSNPLPRVPAHFENQQGCAKARLLHAPARWQRSSDPSCRFERGSSEVPEKLLPLLHQMERQEYSDTSPNAVQADHKQLLAAQHSSHAPEKQTSRAFAL